MDIKNLVPVDYSNQRVLLTAQVAQGLACSVDLLKMLFKNHKGEFQEGVHFFNVKGGSLRALKEKYPLFIDKYSANSMLWTVSGFFLAAKLIDTPQAWEFLRKVGEVLAAEKQPFLDDLIFGQIKPIIRDHNCACVYALDMSDATIKIGSSGDLEKRIITLKREKKLDVLREYHTDFTTRKAALALEKSCHEAFADRRACGEFFNVSFDDAVAEIKRRAKEFGLN